MSPDPTTAPAPAVRAARLRLGVFIVAGLAVTGAIALLVSPQASSQPDGLNKVAIDQGFAAEETEHRFADAPTAGYAVEGIGHDAISTGVSGLIGVALTFVVGSGLVLLVRRTQGTGPGQAPATASTTSGR